MGGVVGHGGVVEVAEFGDDVAVEFPAGLGLLVHGCVDEGGGWCGGEEDGAADDQGRQVGPTRAAGLHAGAALGVGGPSAGRLDDSEQAEDDDELEDGEDRCGAQVEEVSGLAEVQRRAEELERDGMVEWTDSEDDGNGEGELI